MYFIPYLCDHFCPGYVEYHHCLFTLTNTSVSSVAIATRTQVRSIHVGAISIRMTIVNPLCAFIDIYKGT